MSAVFMLTLLLKMIVEGTLEGAGGALGQRGAPDTLQKDNQDNQ